MAGMILDARSHERHDLESVEVVVFGSAPMPGRWGRELTRIFPRARMLQRYACTETIPAATFSLYHPDRASLVGDPGLSPTLVRVTSDSGEELQAGESGDVWLRYPGVPPRRYVGHGAPAVGDGWIGTGDIGSVSAKDGLVLTGRRRDVINVGGLKLPAAEIEGVLLQHPLVRDAACVGIGQENTGEVPAAAVVIDGDLKPSALREFVATRLADYKVPRLIQRFPRLPRNAAGKLDKAEIRRMMERVPGSVHVPPRGPVERRLAAVWGDVLAGQAWGSTTTSSS